LNSQEIAELDEHLIAIELEQCQSWSLSTFIKQAWHVIEPSDPYIGGWCIDAMCEHLEAVTNAQITRIIFNVPPGLMKSLLINVFFPMWEWGVKKLTHHRFINASHNIDLPIRDNNKARLLLDSDWYRLRFPHVYLTRRGDKKLVNSATGFKQVCAIDSLTGSRAHRVSLDDPLSVKDADSPTILESRKRTVLHALPTRLVNQQSSAIMLIMQRLGMRDSTQVLLDAELGYEHFMCPMLFEPERRCITSIGFTDPRTKDKELLFPERFSQAVVDGLRKSLGEYQFAGQMQQRPSPEGGGIVKDHWWVKFEPEYDNNWQIIRPQFNYVLQSWDTAFKTGEQNDYSVCTTWGVGPSGAYLIHRFKDKLVYPDLIDKVKELAKTYNPSIILIEDKASGQSLIQTLKRETRLPIKAFKVDRGNDKVARLHAVSTFIESGRVFLLKNAGWLSDYVYNMGVFPAGDHDDDVDSTSMALAHIFLHTQTKWVPNVNIMGR
jgi:predicted phage terminase large subunit-like protein